METQTSTYQSIKEPSTGIYKDKGSKFLSFVYPIKTENEIKPIIDKLKKEYFDARHHCFAYRFGVTGEIFKTNDDGEPSGTAGKPILGQILSFNLTNILVVVVRYFGGTLLGTGGLIKAYKSATLDAIRNSEIVLCYVSNIYRIKFDYLNLNKIMKIVKDLNIEILDHIYENICDITIKVNKNKVEIMERQLELIEDIDIKKLEII